MVKCIFNNLTEQSFIVTFRNKFGSIKIIPYLCINKNKTTMTKYKVTMKEMGKDGEVRTIQQTAVCNSEREVIEWYGLNEPDIIDYKIEVAE